VFLPSGRSIIEDGPAVTPAILTQIRGLGYVVKEFRVNGVVEFHAVSLKGDEPATMRMTTKRRTRPRACWRKLSAFD